MVFEYTEQVKKRLINFVIQTKRPPCLHNPHSLPLKTLN